MLKANRHCAAVSAKTVVHKLIEESAMTNMHNAMDSGIRLSNLDTNQPDMGTPMKELTGMKSRIVPNSASLRLKVVLIVGMRDAHVEKQMPDKKKNTLKKKRCLFFNSIYTRTIRTQISDVMPKYLPYATELLPRMRIQLA